jgi:regulator of telomere elongation helicase 1
MKELASTTYKPRVSILGSRQQSCLNHSVSQLPATAANQACRALVGKRECKWHRNVEPFLKKNPDTNETIMDIEDLTKLGSSWNLCPYFLSRDMAANADIIFMPYNYLIDPKTRGGLGITWENAVLIFDEAHNVEGVCSDACSFDLPASLLAGAITEAGTAAELAAAQADNAKGFNVVDSYGKMNDGSSRLQDSVDLKQLQMVLRKLEQELAGLKISTERGFTAPGRFLFDLLDKISLNEETWPEMHMIMEKATTLLTADAVEGGRGRGSRSSAYRLHTLHEVLMMAFLTKDAPREGAEPSHIYYRMHVRLEQPPGADRPTPTLGYWCFSPGLAMAALTDAKIRSILLTSGTLSPLGSFAQELTVPFEIRLENPHVIDPSQVFVAVVGKGPRGHALNSSYQSRNRSEYKEDLGNAIVNFARIVPDGLLVFFPSYGVLKQCTDAWRSAGAGGVCIWDRISQYKAPVVEPRDSAMFPAATTDFRAKLDNPAYKGAIFFAVCRGKASEGLDFSDRAGRAVIITGIPYATRTDPKVQIKQDVLNEAKRMYLHPSKRQQPGTAPLLKTGSVASNGSGNFSALLGNEDEPLSGDHWYVQQAIRAVNQAMGRVIRHRRDYGAIILCDERFNNDNVRKQLSKWLRDHVRDPGSFGATAAELTRFFKEQDDAYRKGVIGGGGQGTVPGRALPSDGGGGSGVQGNANNRGAFQIAARNPLNTHDNAGNGSVGDISGQQLLLQSVPAAADMAGIIQLVGGPSAAAAAVGAPALKGAQQAQQQQQVHDAFAVPNNLQPEGLDAIMSELGTSVVGRKGACTNTADGAFGASGSSCLGSSMHAFKASKPTALATTAPGGGSLKPWERAAATVPLDPSAARPHSRFAGFGRGGGAGGAGDGTGSNMVGPAHKIQQHKQQQGNKVEEPTFPGRRALPPPAAERKTKPPPTSDLNPPAAAPARLFTNEDEQQNEDDAAEINGSKAGRTVTEAVPGQLDLMSRLKTELPRESSVQITHALRQYIIDKDRQPLFKAAAAVLHYPDRRSLLEAFKRSVPENLWGAFDVVVEKARSSAAQGHGGGGGGGLEHCRPPPLPHPVVPVKPVRGNNAALYSNTVSHPVHQQGSLGTGSVIHKALGGQGGNGVATTNGAVYQRKVVVSNGVSGKESTGLNKKSIQGANRVVSGNTPPCAICKKICESPYSSACCKKLIACYTCWLTNVALRKCPGCKKDLKKNMLQRQFFG